MIQDLNGKILVSSTTDLHVSDLIMDELFKETEKKYLILCMCVGGD